MLTKEMPATRIDPRARRTRQLILDAFSQLLQQKTFEDITVQDIAERATVNRATFYAHFEDKYMLLEQFVTGMVQQTLDAKLPPEAGFNAANLQLLIQTVAEFLERLRTHCAPSNRNQFDSVVEQQVKQQIYAILLRWSKESDSSRDTDEQQAELQATVTSWAIYGAATRWNTSHRRESAVEFARRALPMIMAGMEVAYKPT